MRYGVLVSGGVDSAVALRRVMEQGHDVTAVYLKIWLEDELSFLGSCPWEEDLAFVRAVCQQAGVPLEIISLQQAYHERVVQYLLDQVRAGLTPNPDMLCNQQIKFGAAYDHFGAAFDRIATGHYARVEHGSDGMSRLRLSADAVKDQTYFLALLSQQQLHMADFPIGDMAKSEVRAYASRYELPNAARKDSQGICFLGKISFSEFLRYHLGVSCGPIVEYETGTVLGQHQGYWYHTVGQRSGLGLSGGPWYVVRKNVHENIVYVSRAYADVQGIRQEFRVPRPHWMQGAGPTDTRVRVKVRHGAQFHDAIVVQEPDGACLVKLAVPDQGIASGQFAVFYQNEICLGGGAMEQKIESEVESI